MASGKLNLGAFVPALATAEEDLRPVFVVRADGAALQHQALRYNPQMNTFQQWTKVYYLLSTQQLHFQKIFY